MDRTGGSTMTKMAMDYALNTMWNETADLGNARVTVLITDGKPFNDAQNPCGDTLDAYAAAGIDVAVIAFGDATVSDGTLVDSFDCFSDDHDVTTFAYEDFKFG